MKKETYNSLVAKVEILSKLVNGGKGSGNFGHGGRPGKVGGSSSSGGFSKGQDGKGASSEAEKELKDAKAKVDKLDKALKDLDKEGVPFTSPRYQATYDDYKKAKSDYLKKETEYQKSGEAKKDKSSKSSKKDSVGPAKIAKKDVQKLLQPDHDRYTREVVDVKYDSDKDRYEAKTVVKFKDGSPNSKESWSTMPGGDPKKSSSWFVDNTPTWFEGLSERIDKAHGK